MTELSLFTGIGGGLLGTECLLGWQCIGAVEIDEYCCRVLRQRQLDGCFNGFPIWNMDIREFNRRIAPSYHGKVDVITAGFPCQPFSVAGKRRGDQDERNMWPATIECIRLVWPRYLLLENVPGLLTHEYVRRIYGDLAESGYCVKWRCLSAAEVGANHKRNRWWLVADAKYRGSQERWAKGSETYVHQGNEYMRSETSELYQDVPHTNGRRLESSDNVSHTPEPGLEGQKPEGQSREYDRLSTECSQDVADAAQRSDGRCGQSRENAGGVSWWSTEPDVGRVVDEYAYRIYES